MVGVIGFVLYFAIGDPVLLTELLLEETPQSKVIESRDAK
jgi:hypothetical protein